MLNISNLTLCYPKGAEALTPVLSSFSLCVAQGEIMGLVGESGSGKTSLALAILGLLDTTACLVEGEIRWRGTNLLSAGEQGLQSIRGKEIALIFQQPQAALNPVLPAGRQILDLLALHRHMTRRDQEREALTLFERVGLADPQRIMTLYPHQLSGGMAQRVMIAMALACQPSLLIADEPTASLDVTIQAQIMDLLLEIREQTGMAILLVSHDLGVVADLCDTVAVVYQGRVVEQGPAERICSSPAHPYTRALLAAIPGSGRRRFVDHPRPSRSRLEWQAGCAYADRCAVAVSRCFSERPPRRSLGKDEHVVDCWLGMDDSKPTDRDGGASWSP